MSDRELGFYFLRLYLTSVVILNVAISGAWSDSLRHKPWRGLIQDSGSTPR